MGVNIVHHPTVKSQASAGSTFDYIQDRLQRSVGRKHGCVVSLLALVREWGAELSNKNRFSRMRYKTFEKVRNEFIGRYESICVEGLPSLGIMTTPAGFYCIGKYTSHIRLIILIPHTPRVKIKLNSLKSIFIAMLKYIYS